MKGKAERGVSLLLKNVCVFVLCPGVGVGIKAVEVCTYAFGSVWGTAGDVGNIVFF